MNTFCVSVKNPVDPLKVRQGICELESDLSKMEQLPIEPTHIFADGIYAREIFIPKGTLLVGKIHAKDHVNVVSKGDISVITEEGVKRIVAPATFVAKPGTKRVGYAHEDTVWTTFHASKETDLEKLEDELILKDFPDTISDQNIKELMGGCE